jgi:hypothetical protein
MPESENHKKIKDLIYNKLNEWYGCSIPEYYDEAHELDVYAVTTDGISIYTEVIWTSTEGNFLRDLMIIQRANADLIFVVVNPILIEMPERVREYQKTQTSKRKSKQKMSPMLNGDRILSDMNYVDYEIKQLIDSYLMEKREEGKPPQPDLYIEFLDNDDEPIDELTAEPLYIKKQIVKKVSKTPYMEIQKKFYDISRSFQMTGLMEKEPSPDLVPIKLLLGNKGTIGAKDIHIFLKFPKGCNLFSDREVRGGIRIQNNLRSPGLYVTSSTEASAEIDSLGNDLIFKGWLPIYVRFPEIEQDYVIEISIIQEGWPRIDINKNIHVSPKSKIVEIIEWQDE